MSQPANIIGQNGQHAQNGQNGRNGYGSTQEPFYSNA